MAIQTAQNNQEFDLFMRVDPNTRGHHQWFFFSIENYNFLGNVKFNILNFTQRNCLFSNGMQVTYKSLIDLNKNKDLLQVNEGWQKGGTNIQYGSSKINKKVHVSWNEKTMAKRRNEKKYY